MDLDRAHREPASTRNHPGASEPCKRSRSPRTVVPGFANTRTWRRRGLATATSGMLYALAAEAAADHLASGAHLRT